MNAPRKRTPTAVQRSIRRLLLANWSYRQIAVYLRVSPRTVGRESKILKRKS